MPRIIERWWSTSSYRSLSRRTGNRQYMGQGLRRHGAGFERLEDRTLLAVDLGYAIGLGSSFFLDVGGGVATDADGNAYVTGMFGGTVDFDPGPGTFNLSDSGGSSSGDVFVAKYSPAGELLWAGAITGGGFLANTGSAIAVDDLGNVFVGGAVDDAVDLDPGPGSFLVNAQGTGDGFIVKLDANGNFLWGGLISGPGGNGVNSLDVDGSGSVYLAGGFGSPFGGGADLDPGPGTFNVAGLGGFAVKLDGNGQFVWGSVADGGASPTGISIDSSGDVLVAGYYQGTADFDPGPGTSFLTAAGATDLFAWKLDSGGNLVWARSAGGTSPLGDGSNGVAVNAAGDVLVSGLFSGTADFDPGAGVFNLTSAGSHDAVLWKLDSSGNFLAAHQFGGTGFDMATGITVDLAGDEYLFGEFSAAVDFDPGPGVFNLTSAGSADSFLTKLQPDGTFVWAVSAGGSGQESSAAGGPDIAVDPAGNVYSTGRFSGTADFDPGPGAVNLTSNGGFDAFLWKLTQTPDVVGVQIDVKPGSDPNSVNLASLGVIPVTLFTTADFDASQVDVSTVVFAGATAYRSALEDVDADGDLDLVLHFRTQETNLLEIYKQLIIDDFAGDGDLDSSRQQAEISLTGQTVDGAVFEGFDTLDLFLAGKQLRDLLDDLAADGLI